MSGRGKFRGDGDLSSSAALEPGEDKSSSRRACR